MALTLPTNTSAISHLGLQSVDELTSLAARGLASMYDDESGLFCYRLRRRRHDLVREGFSHRYTTLAALGVCAFQKTGATCPLGAEGAFNSCIRNPDWISGIGDLGIAIWFAAEYAPDELEELFRRMKLGNCLDRFADAREGRTMETAWFLAGLSHAAAACPNSSWPLDDLAVEAYRRLQDNRRDSGLFAHAARKNAWQGWLRGRIGNFADQFYSIYALTKFATAFDLEEPLESAMECALVVGRLQGSLGQWWWCYDAAAGRVLSRYPVYAVEQYGIAPLALIALQQATQYSFKDSVERGLKWVFGSNELGEDLRSPTRALIWAGIVPNARWEKYRDFALNCLRVSHAAMPAERATESLRVVHETRPYELGLLLYCFSKFALSRT